MGASSSEENHGRFRNIFNKRGQSRAFNPVYQAAYWGDRSDFLQEKPKDDVNPTTILQFLMLYPNYRNNKERVNYRGNTPLHLALNLGRL